MSSLHVLLLAGVGLAAAAPALLSRASAFEAVYSEGRWFKGVDGAACRSGWSSLEQGQATAALAALETVLNDHDLDSLLDLPVGDGCFAEGALARIRASGKNISYHGALARVLVRTRSAIYSRRASGAQGWTLWRA